MDHQEHDHVQPEPVEDNYEQPVIEEQLVLPLDIPVPDSYTVELRKGDLHALQTEESTQVSDLEGVASAVKAYRNHSSAEEVTWSAPSIIAGTCLGLAPEGVVYEICVIPAVTIDA